MAFGSYRKGSRAERELMLRFESSGFSVIRAAGSGKGSVCPDMLAFKGKEWLAFECKAVDSPTLQIDTGQFIGLREWEENSGMTVYVAWRLKGGEWRFIRLPFFKQNKKSFSISKRDAVVAGELIDAVLKI